MVPSERRGIDNPREVRGACSVPAGRCGDEGGGVCCFRSWTSVPTADFVLGTEPMGLRFTGLATLVVVMGFSCASIEHHHVPGPGME